MGFRTNAVTELTERFNRIEHSGKLAESFSRLSNAISSLEQLNSARDLRMPEAHHTAKVGRAAQNLAQKLPQFKNQALATWSDEQGRISGADCRATEPEGIQVWRGAQAAHRLDDAHRQHPIRLRSQQRSGSGPMLSERDPALDVISASHRTASVMTTEYQDVQALERIAQAESAAKEAQQRMSEALA